jgi:biotin operon repressor
MQKLLIVFDVGMKLGMTEDAISEAIRREQPGRLPEDFSAAMREYTQLCEELGDEHPEAKRALAKALHIAPRWFLSDVWEKTGDPLPTSYTEDGQAVITSTALAEHLGVSHEEVCEKIEEMEEMLGITVPRTSGTLHRVQ